MLHLLDRQVVDRDGLLVCKVDDLEVMRTADDGWEVTGILVGPAALLPRYAGRGGRRILAVWHQLGIQQEGRDRPWRIGFDLVTSVGSAVHLRVSREAVLKDEGPDGSAPGRHRLAELIGAEVRWRGESCGKVLDVRLRPTTLNALEVTGLLIGRARPGAFLGYERRESMGPAWLRGSVRWLMRHSGELPIQAVCAVDWGARRIIADDPPGPVTPLG
ncbi:hypothetical protein [Nocardioides sp.]|uniref:hypothetical protein n=1 Tax=Nocardioides sp. TaxID=35761 RepID=UPI0026288556|nr:hypothetical protein [Nocardioides sp.]